MLSAERWSPTRMRLSLWLWVLGIVGYPVVGLLATLLNWESTLASIPFRAAVLGLALVTLALSPQKSAWWLRQRWLLLFWAAYLLRLLWDLAVAGVPGAGEALFTFVVISALPAMAVGLGSGGTLPERATAWRMGLLAAWVCLLATTMQFMGWGAAQTLDPVFTGGRLVFVAVNPITLGHAATTTLVCVLCLSRYSMGAASRLALVLMALVAAVCLLSAGSRGPAASLAVCALVFALATGQRKWVLLMALLLLPAILNPDTDFAQRIESAAGDDASSLERLVMQTNALQQFIENPLFGSAHVELFSASYPHNLLIEAAMALGLPGLLLMMLLLVSASLTAWRQMRRGQTLAALLFVQYLVAAQFSGSIWGMSPLWAALVLLGAAGGQAPRVNPRSSTSPPQMVVA